MKATGVNLQNILNSPNQYVIPVFQRYYSWEKNDWEKLWDDLLELGDVENPARSHFMGSLVFVPEKHYPDAVPAYQVIDGQQRLVTMSLLLCALRDVASDRNLEPLAEEIIQTFLIHPFRTGRERLRVYPRQRDRYQYIGAVESNGTLGGRIEEALRFYTGRISQLPTSNTEAGLRDFFNLLKGQLEFVSITLEDENPYQIFKSLNSTGVDLSEADLIRNFTFMHVDINDQDDFDDSLWRPLEEHFKKPDGGVHGVALSSFLRDYLMRQGRYVPLSSTFHSSEKRYEGADFDAYELTRDLVRHAEYYDVIRGLEIHPSAEVNKSLMKLRQLESSTTYPLLLNLMRKVEEGEIDALELAEAIELLAGFILRRFISGESSRTYGRWFVSACSELGDEPVEELRKFLVGRVFPNDTRSESHLVHFPLFGSRYNRSMLETLERAHPHKEPPDLTLTQVEHIMPQTLTPQWQDDLGPEADRIYDEWLHTLGNLTLSAYNPELYNHPFPIKREQYAKSNITLTRQLADNTTWTEADIQVRGQHLAALASKIWKGPDS